HLTSTARKKAKPGRGDERFKLIPQGTGKALIPDQDAGLQVAFLCPFCEVSGCHEGDFVVNHNALGMKAGANRRIGGKRPGIVVDARTLWPRPMILPEPLSKSAQDLVL